jgi:hypothetical protein
LGRRSVPVAFVHAESARELEVIFASGIMMASTLDDEDLWVEHDGLVAFITADHASEELAQDAGDTWISLSRGILAGWRSRICEGSA